ncbi:MAG: beta-galactosidase [Verrucomicrobiota bacterium]
MNRRSFLKAATFAAVSLPAWPALDAKASETNVSTPDRGGLPGLKRIGALKPKAAADIKDSRIGIGMECLDRRLYLPEKTYGHLAALGAKWARIQTGWSRCETKEGEYDFAWLDDVIDHVIAAGVKPWFNVGYGNKIYSPDAPHESAVGQVPLYDGERGINAWKNFLRALAAHFKDRVEYWEIWNEPNIDSFWHPKHPSSAVEYTKLVAISAGAIRNRHPQARIVACENGMETKFFEECLKAGMGDHIQCFSIHPYTAEQIPELEYPAGISRLRNIIHRLAPHVQLWQGECGTCSLNTGHADAWRMKLWNMNETNQAKWIARRLMLDLFLDLGRAQYFHLCDMLERPYRMSDGKPRLPNMLGILNGKTYTPKIGFAAMQSVATLFDGDTLAEPGYYCALLPAAKDATLNEPYTMLFRRRGSPLLAYYQATDVQDEAPALPIDIELSCDRNFTKSAKVMADPVLIDPITQSIYALPKPERGTVKGQYRSSLRFKNLPCLNYPLIITDRSAID